MSEKHYPYYGGAFDRIVFDKDGSVWVPESEISKLRACLGDGCADCAIGMGEYADSLCDPLKAENAKLRMRLAQYELFEDVIGDPSTEFARLRRELHRLQLENAKLRDLVCKMAFPYKYGDLDCGPCPHMDKCWDSETLEFDPDGCVILQMVRELGIEVE